MMIMVRKGMWPMCSTSGIMLAVVQVVDNYLTLTCWTGFEAFHSLSDLEARILTVIELFCKVVQVTRFTILPE